jgi:hypothetical protein
MIIVYSWMLWLGDVIFRFDVWVICILFACADLSLFSQTLEGVERVSQRERRLECSSVIMCTWWNAVQGPAEGCSSRNKGGQELGVGDGLEWYREWLHIQFWFMCTSELRRLKMIICKGHWYLGFEVSQRDQLVSTLALLIMCRILSLPSCCWARGVDTFSLHRSAHAVGNEPESSWLGSLHDVTSRSQNR